MQINNLHFQTLPSTNTYAKEHFNDFNQDELTIISTEHQTQGRGQFNKAWLSEKSGASLTASYCFFIKNLKNVHELALVMAFTLKKVLKNLSVEALIKWPNDVMVENKKIGGILTEVTDLFVVIGVGLNLCIDEKVLSKIDQPATSLHLHTDRKFQEKDLRLQIAEELISRMGLFR